MAERAVILTPKAERDLLRLEKRQAQMIVEDLELLPTAPWPPGKVKKLRGSDFWEIKTGDFRTIFLPRESDLIIIRIVNRRDLDGTMGRIDIRALHQWLQDRERD